MDTSDLRGRNTVIRHDSTSDEYQTFSQRIEMLHSDVLADIAARLGVSPQSTWQDYRDSLSAQSWDDFIEAYEHCTSRSY